MTAIPIHAIVSWNLWSPMMSTSYSMDRVVSTSWDGSFVFSYILSYA
jgi:hypothetical protein